MTKITSYKQGYEKKWLKNCKIENWLFLVLLEIKGLVLIEIVLSIHLRIMSTASWVLNQYYQELLKGTPHL